MQLTVVFCPEQGGPYTTTRETIYNVRECTHTYCGNVLKNKLIYLPWHHWVYICKLLTLFSIDGKVLAEELQRILGSGHEQSVQHALVQCKDALFLCIVWKFWRNRQPFHLTLSVAWWLQFTLQIITLPGNCLHTVPWGIGVRTGTQLTWTPPIKNDHPW